MTFLQALNEYFDTRVSEPSWRRGPYEKIKRAEFIAKERGVDNIDEFIQIVEDQDIPERTWKLLRAIMNYMEKHHGIVATRSIESVAHGLETPRKPRKYDFRLEEILTTLRLQSGVIGCLSALALCGLRPQDIVQVDEVKGNIITFIGDREPQTISTHLQHVVDEFVTDDLLIVMKTICRVTGDPKVDGYEIIDLFNMLQQKEDFSLTIKQLRYCGAINTLIMDGHEAIADVAERLNVKVQSLLYAIQRWTEQESITPETASKLCPH